ncbi:MAG: anti-sigma factor [Rhodoferax sp.]|jgi:anti-sigma-K factor RskA
MNLLKTPELLERIASNYALGTLRGGARRRFEAMAREQAPVRAAALIWQSRLASINELQAQVQPDAVVWTRINNLVQGEKTVAAQAAVRAQTAASVAQLTGVAAWLRSLTLWRTATAVGALATVAVVTIGVGQRQEFGGEIARLQNQLLTAPQVEYVAVLADDKATASMLVTFDPKAKKLTLQRVGAYQEAGDRSLQLWALPPAGGPKSLGVLSRDKLLRLTAAEGDVHEIPTLAISLEPRGGVPSETGPTGPVLFKGALIQKML